jgi:hypothetical protein
LLASGTPEAVAGVAASHTGRYLARMLRSEPTPAPKRRRSAAKA